MSYLSPANRPSTRRADRLAVAISSKLTPRLNGESFGGMIVTEFPKCGGTWLSSVLGCYLDIPFPRQSRLPITFPAILHGHWQPNQCRGPIIFLTRDPRDVAVSHLRHVLNRPPSSGGYWEREIAKRVGASAREVPFGELLDVWVDLQVEGQHSTRTWTGFVSPWLSRIEKGTVTLARYEDLVKDTPAAVSEILRHQRLEIDEERLLLAIGRFDFGVVAGRRAGDEDTTSFYRLGLAEAWRALGDNEVRILNRLISDEARQLGYQ